MFVVDEEEVLRICALIRKKIKLYERYLLKIDRKNGEENIFNSRTKCVWERTHEIEALMNSIGLDYNVATLAFFGHKKSLRYFKTGEADLFLVMHLNNELIHKNRAKIWKS